MHYLARCSLSELNTLWEWGDLSISESNLRPPLIWYVGSHESDQSTRKTEDSLTPRALADWSCLGDHASVVSQRYNTIAIITIHYTEVAKHLNITYDVRDAENAGGIAECSHIMDFTV